MNVLSLFSGIGGLDLGLERAGMTVAGQVEIDPWCRKVLAKHWPEVPRHDDVRTAVEWWGGRRSLDLVCGGFPCQPVSLAGKGLAQADSRWLWPAFADIIRRLRPRYVLVDAHEGLRRLEASLRRDVTGHTGPKRGGSDANTMAALKAIEALGHAVTADAMAEAARILDRWSRQIQELPAVDEAERPQKVAARCPYCGFGMLRVYPRSGQVTCLRYGACFDADGRHPVGTMEVGRLSPQVRWQDGLVAP